MVGVNGQVENFQALVVGDFVDLEPPHVEYRLHRGGNGSTSVVGHKRETPNRLN